MTGLRRFRRDRRGHMLVMTAIFVPVIAAVLALAVDLGFSYIARTRIAQAAELAAESGRIHLPNAEQARQTAISIATIMARDAGRVVDALDIEAEAESGQVTVIIRASVRPMFSRLMGSGGTELRVEARRLALP